MSFLEEHLGSGTWRADPPCVGVELSSVVGRRDFGLDWQEALPGGGDTLGWEVTLEALIEFVERTK